VTYDEARRLVIFESCVEQADSEGLIVLVRCTGEPGAERVIALLNALKAVFEWHVGKDVIERKPANALHILAQEIINQTEGPRRTKSEFYKWERWDIASAAEGVLQGEWPDEWLSYGKRRNPDDS